MDRPHIYIDSCAWESFDNSAQGKKKFERHVSGQLDQKQTYKFETLPEMYVRVHIPGHYFGFLYNADTGLLLLFNGLGKTGDGQVSRHAHVAHPCIHAFMLVIYVSMIVNCAGSQKS